MVAPNSDHVVHYRESAKVDLGEVPRHRRFLHQRKAWGLVLAYLGLLLWCGSGVVAEGASGRNRSACAALVVLLLRLGVVVYRSVFLQVHKSRPREYNDACPICYASGPEDCAPTRRQCFPGCSICGASSTEDCDAALHS